MYTNFLVYTTDCNYQSSCKHLYADDIQLFLSFHPSEFHSNITHLQNTLQQISSWMTANLLTLNSSKTEFLLIGLKQQLSEIHDSTLTTIHSARNLGFIFHEHLTFSDQISALSKSCCYHIRELCCICPYLDFKTASTIATSIVHSKLDYCITIFQTINLTGSNKFKTFLLVLLLRLLNPQMSLPFSNISTGLTSTNALNINFFLLPTKFLQPVNLAISTVWSLFNKLAVPAPHLLSLFLAHQASPHWKSQIDHSDMHHPVSGINLLILSVSLASHVSTHLLIHVSVRLCHHQHCHHPSLLHSFNTRLKNLPFQQILPTLIPVLLLPLDCLHNHGTGPELLCFSIYF